MDQILANAANFCGIATNIDRIEDPPIRSTKRSRVRADVLEPEPKEVQ